MRSFLFSSPPSCSQPTTLLGPPQFAYLQNVEAAAQRADIGPLLYASAGARFEHQYLLGERRLRACALDLDQPWLGGRADMLTPVRALHAEPVSTRT